MADRSAKNLGLEWRLLESIATVTMSSKRHPSRWHCRCTASFLFLLARASTNASTLLDLLDLIVSRTRDRRTRIAKTRMMTRQLLLPLQQMLPPLLPGRQRQTQTKPLQSASFPPRWMH